MVVYNQIGCIQLKNGCSTTILNENGCILMKMVVYNQNYINTTKMVVLQPKMVVSHNLVVKWL